MVITNDVYRWEDYLKKQQDDSDASKKALNDGDQYWKQGLHKFLQAREKVTIHSLS